MADSIDFSADYYNLANIGRFTSNNYTRQAVLKRELVLPEDYSLLAQEAADLFSGVDYAMINLDFSAFITALRLDPENRSCKWGTVTELFIAARPEQLDLSAALGHDYRRSPGCVINLSYPVEDLDMDFLESVTERLKSCLAPNAIIQMGVAGVPRGAAVGVGLWLLVPGDNAAYSPFILSQEETYNEMLNLFKRK